MVAKVVISLHGDHGAGGELEAVSVDQEGEHQIELDRDGIAREEGGR